MSGEWKRKVKKQIDSGKIQRLIFSISPQFCVTNERRNHWTAFFFHFFLFVHKKYSWWFWLLRCTLITKLNYNAYKSQRSVLPRIIIILLCNDSENVISLIHGFCWWMFVWRQVAVFFYQCSVQTICFAVLHEQKEMAASTTAIAVHQNKKFKKNVCVYFLLCDML